MAYAQSYYSQWVPSPNDVDSRTDLSYQFPQQSVQLSRVRSKKPLPKTPEEDDIPAAPSHPWPGPVLQTIDCYQHLQQYQPAMPSTTNYYVGTPLAPQKDSWFYYSSSQQYQYETNHSTNGYHSAHWYPAQTFVQGRTSFEDSSNYQQASSAYPSASTETRSLRVSHSSSHSSFNSGRHLPDCSGSQKIEQKDEMLSSEPPVVSHVKLQKPFEPPTAPNPMRITIPEQGLLKATVSDGMAKNETLSPVSACSSATTTLDSSMMPETPNDNNSTPQRRSQKQQQQLLRPSSPSGIPSPWGAVSSEVSVAPVAVEGRMSHQHQPFQHPPQRPNELERNVGSEETKTRSQTRIASFSLTQDREALKIYRRMAVKTRDRDIQMTYTKYLLEIAELYNQGEAVGTTITGSVTDNTMTGNLTRSSTQKRLLAEAGYWIHRLAKSGHAEALFIQGQWYMHGPPSGIGPPKVHPQKAVRCFQAAAKAGWVDAYYELAQHWRSRKVYAKAIANYRIAAAKGHTLATYKLARVLLRGRWGQERDIQQGMVYLRRAADVTDATCAEPAFVLSCVYAGEPDSFGLPKELLTEFKDVQLAIQYLTKAANYHLADAIRRLGQVYEQGLLDQTQQPAQSLQYYTKAAEEGHVYAMLDLSRLYVQGIPGHLICQPRLGFRWCQRAAEKGLAKAEYILGTYYEDGVGVPSDYSQALQCFNKAASKGYSLAAEKLNRPNHEHKLQNKQKLAVEDDDVEEEEMSIRIIERPRLCMVM
ncbi:hypothetical protein EC973_001610 [Apophysomyces ossiformis]|uniref:Uncharacterized protein n=1 Tax=Apophysomyces ossiformis TaxID=679940 RepID=A0A8H7ETA6_9FUNG|nr:hypothetical protein EC973_001610 [Apophysomyces ossiformis]